MPALLVHRECESPVVADLLEAAVELDDILESAVRALAEEGEDRVRGIADERDLRVGLPRIGVQSGEQPDRVVLVVLDQCGHERYGVGVLPFEVRGDLLGRRQIGRAHV